MRFKVHTDSGSVYVFDKDAMTWTRSNKRGLRGEPDAVETSGALERWPEFVLGERFVWVDDHPVRGAVSYLSTEVTRVEVV